MNLPAIPALPPRGLSSPLLRQEPLPASVRRSTEASRRENSSALVAPFASLRAANGRPLRIAILSDFTRIPYANGAVLQTRALYQELRRCGHEVTLIGPKDPNAQPGEVPPGTIALPSLPLRTYPGVHIPLPLESWVFDPSRWNFDLCFAQTCSLLLEFGVWLRKMRGIPLLCVNTTHLAAAYSVLLPERLSKMEAVKTGIEFLLRRPMEHMFTNLYNQSDGLMVLSPGLRDYWRERGVSVPIHVIPRAVQADTFDRPTTEDPFITMLKDRGLESDGARFLCAGRHTREKSQDRVVRIFARNVLPVVPDATLTMLGAGPDTGYYKRIARELGVAERVIFVGEVPFAQMVGFYRSADVLLHASLSETFGNVLGEALWCGLPAVAFADGMGVSAQAVHRANAIVIEPERTSALEEDANIAFGHAAVELVRNNEMRERMSTEASRYARERCSPAVVQRRLAEAFQHARTHAAVSGIRPLFGGPKPLQWYETFRHFRSWTAGMGSVYLCGFLRPWNDRHSRQSIQPLIGR